MKKDTLYAIGEALIDFIPDKKGCSFSDITAFSPNIGGAPANVCGAFSKLGGKSQMITQLGDDPFGHKIAEELASSGVGTDFCFFTGSARTCLAFVSLEADGNRTFSFYRDPSADMLLEKEKIQKDWFQNAYALHFCSVALTPSPMREAHRAAIEYAQAAGSIISFDPNLRFMLWKDKEALRQTVFDFLPMADIVKISDEELEWLTGLSDEDAALQKIFCGNVSLVLYTCGKRGAYGVTRDGRKIFSPGIYADAIDTTGAGDAFSGSFLYKLYADSVAKEQLQQLTDAKIQEYLDFSNRFCSVSVSRKGAIASYPTAEEMKIY